jgi:hypothetical protein
LRASGSGALVRVGGAVLRLHLESSTAHTTRLLSGATDPPQGWVSRRYGEMQPATVLETRMMTRAPALFATVVAPTTESRSRRLHAGVRSEPVRVLEPGTGRARAIALTIPRPRGEDLLVLASRGTSIEVGPCRARAEVLWMRLEDDRPVRLLALDAGYVEVARRRYLELDQPTSQFFWSTRQSAATPTVTEEREHVRYRRDR